MEHRQYSETLELRVIDVEIDLSRTCENFSTKNKPQQFIRVNDRSYLLINSEERQSYGDILLNVLVCDIEQPIPDDNATSDFRNCAEVKDSIWKLADSNDEIRSITWRDTNGIETLIYLNSRLAILSSDWIAE